MSNQINKNKNKLKDKDEICIAQDNLILAQQAERRRRFQKIVDRNRSVEELLEETRQRVELVEEAREELLNLYSLREENPNGRELTRTDPSVEGARTWSELFVRDILLEQTTSEDPSSPKNATVENKTPVRNSAGVGA